MKKPCKQNNVRRYASGGLLDSFNKRQQEVSASSGFNALPETPSVAQSMAEGAANFGMNTRPTAQSTLDGIVSNSNLSGRQKSSAAMALNDSAGSLDTSGIRGLSARQNMGLTVDQFNADAKMQRQKPLVQAAFADGGKIDPDELMRRMASKYGTTGAAQAAPQPAPQPVQQAQPQARPQGIVGLLGGRKEQLEQQERKALGYANGGKIQGPGTPTSDDIDAEVVETKEPIKVSTGERIVSHAQGQLLEKVAKGIGYKSLDDLLEAGTGHQY